MYRTLARLLILVGVILSSTSIGAAREVRPTDRVKRNVVVRSEPRTSSAFVGALAPGGQADLLEDVSGWFRVRLVNGVVGYVSKTWTTTSGEPLTAADTSRFRLHVIDVGTGLAVFVEGPGFTMLYDGGSQDDLATGDDNRVLAYLRAVRPDMAAIDHLVLSHPHKDHVELLPDVFDRYVVRNVWDSGAVNPTRGYCRFLSKVAAEPGVLYHDAIATGGVHSVTFQGSGCSGTIRVPQATMMTAAPVPLGSGAAMSILYRDASRHADPNENSVVVRLDLGSHRVLLTGEAEGVDRSLTSSH